MNGYIKHIGLHSAGSSTTHNFLVRYTNTPKVVNTVVANVTDSTSPRHITSITTSRFVLWQGSLSLSWITEGF